MSKYGLMLFEGDEIEINLNEPVPILKRSRFM